VICAWITVLNTEGEPNDHLRLPWHGTAIVDRRLHEGIEGSLV
jgi:hypothetical protein